MTLYYCDVLYYCDFPTRPDYLRSEGGDGTVENVPCPQFHGRLLTHVQIVFSAVVFHLFHYISTGFGLVRVKSLLLAQLSWMCTFYF